MYIRVFYILKTNYLFSISITLKTAMNTFNPYHVKYESHFESGCWPNQWDWFVLFLTKTSQWQLAVEMRIKVC